MPSRAELNLRARVVGIDPANYPNDSTLEQRVIYNEKLATASAGTKATGTLTSDATAPSNNDTVTIGSTVYTFKTALTGVVASQTLTSDATAPSDGDTVTIGPVTYTFKTTLSSSPVPNEVLIGASAAIALDNLKIAINASGGTIGTEYSLGTVANPAVTATTNTDTTQVVEAILFGTQGNSVQVAENSTHLSWGASALAGGVNPVANEVLIGASAAAALDNLKSAINASAGAGTTYSRNTVAHESVTATTNTDTTQVVEARQTDIGNASIATTEASTHLSWGAATLASGVPGTIAAPAGSAEQVSGGAPV